MMQLQLHETHWGLSIKDSKDQQEVAYVNKISACAKAQGQLRAVAHMMALSPQLAAALQDAVELADEAIAGNTVATDRLSAARNLVEQLRQAGALRGRESVN